MILEGDGAAASKRRTLLRRHAAEPAVAADLSYALEERRRGVVDGGGEPIRLPLLLITQVQRSGGTLLSTLFDGHPMIASYPWELNIGHPKKWNWPRLDMSAGPGEWLALLFDDAIPRLISKGYLKAKNNKAIKGDRRPFGFDIRAFADTFYDVNSQARCQRDVLDSYFTAYFAGWRDQDLTGRERWIVGFCPRLISEPDSVTGFFEDYPEGALLSCIRNPVSWFASSSRHSPEYASIDDAIALWRASTESALRLHQAEPSKVWLTTYDDLVKDTEGVMRRLAGALRIDFQPILVQPTYAGAPRRSNSSYDLADAGVHARSLDRSDQLTREDLATIDRELTPLYLDAVAEVRRAAS